MASEHPVMERARRGPKGTVDSFLAFWLGILADGRQAKYEVSRTRTRRSVDKFLGSGDVQAARGELGDDALAAELRDAAELYFTTCLTDIAYTSTMFRTKRMESGQVIGKAAQEAAAAVGVLRESGGRDPFSSRLPRLLLEGWISAIGREHVAVLRGALLANRSASPLAEFIPES